AEALERMAQVDTLVVDKTGTITQGRPSVDKVGSFDTGSSEQEVLEYIVSVNSNSEHPLARATVDHGNEKNVQPLKSEDFTAVTGMGSKVLSKGKGLPWATPK